ncbi:uncharacterized protein LOC108096777 [Drosophila ficusphila]|uniref:uncharacterized protein LOC108096777 n=1 Tax=Drosophila ficusphila TaxID=30025 RepID=UPI0007E6BE5F|nr:uncharacterized protein LOC108096777 [Drosophila ficusphila]
MKFFAILVLLCAILGFAMAASSTSTTEASDTTQSPSKSPCGGPCGKKLYFFYK